MFNPRPQPVAVAYFSMEVGLESAMPTYSGGLGVLAGDTLRAAADFSVPMVGVTLLHRKGYFRQHLDRNGQQYESPRHWRPEEFLEPLPTRVQVTLEGRPVQVGAWRYLVRGISGHAVPVYFLDTAQPENTPEDQAITDVLYGGDARYRLRQEAVLGIGGVAMLRALGHDSIQSYHMNEGHSSLLALALLEAELQGRRTVTPADLEAVRQQCVFTTHTPVPAGHDQFALDLVRQVLGPERAATLEAAGCITGGTLNMTYLGLRCSRYINGVSLRHEQVSTGLFPEFPINAITNGVHAVTWATPPFARLFDRHIPQWRRDNLYLRYARGIPLGEILAAHAEAKQNLLDEVERRTGVGLDPNVFTIGFARRATEYKRADLLFCDHERLRRIARAFGGLQVVYAGKAHPRDEGGKALIRRIFEASALLQDSVRVVYLEDYDMDLGRLVTGGVDLWLNNPQKPREASGTSGMKAALNGVPSLSVLDGWWIEGHFEGVTGWSIGEDWEPALSPYDEAVSMYDKLEQVILPLYHQRRREYAEVMRSAIAINGSFFTAQRMMLQYLENSYRAFRNGP